MTEAAETIPPLSTSLQSPTHGERPGRLAIFKGDLRALHAHQTGRIGRLVDRVGGRLEKIGKAGRYRVMICPPLTLFHGLRGKADSPSRFIHQFYLRGLWAERTNWGKLKLVLALKPDGDRRSRKSLSDKEIFHAVCRDKRLVTVEQLACASNGEWRSEAAGETLPRCDLFVKPRIGRGGSGAKRWDYDGTQWRSAGLAFDEVGLISHLKDLSLSAPLVIQKRGSPPRDF